MAVIGIGPAPLRDVADVNSVKEGRKELVLKNGAVVSRRG